MAAKQEALASIRALHEFYEKAGALTQLQGISPKPGSIAAKGLDEYEREESVQSVHAQGSILLQQATDHLAAFIQLAINHEITLALSANARAVVENSAIAYWLLDREVTIHKRVCRSLSFRKADLEQQRKIAKAWDPDFDPTNIDQRLDVVEALSVRLGFERISRVRFTEIVRDTIGYEAHYRVLSALVHGNTSPLRQLGYQEVESLEGDDGVTIERSVPPLVVIYLCQVVAGAFIDALGAKFQLFGWDIDGLANEVNPVLHILNTVVENR